MLKQLLSNIPVISDCNYTLDIIDKLVLVQNIGQLYATDWNQTQCRTEIQLCP